MNVVDQAIQTQLKNIQARTGKSLQELFELIRASGLSKHGEIRALLQRELGLGYGDANTLTHHYLGALTQPAPSAGGAADPLDEIYTDSKAGLRPLHEAVMVLIEGLGPFEIAPKKGYLSLRRKRQFAMLGPGSSTRVDLGLNMKSVAPKGRLAALPPGGMCQYQVRLTSIDDVDEELMGWIKTAYESAA